MTFMQKVKARDVLSWVSSNIVESRLKSIKTPFWPIGSFHIAGNPRLYGTKRTSRPEKSEVSVGTSSGDGDDNVRISRAIQKQAQIALFEYFYGTRSLSFVDAEHLSKNAPNFVENLLKRINVEVDTGQSLTRFLRYHPINEFEPFFESSGLEPPEYGPLLPRDLIYLSDDGMLLENYHVLCNYGIARNKIGKIYKEAVKVFTYDSGVLLSKLQAYEELGLSQRFMSKVIVCSPSVLIGDVNMELLKVLDILKSMGFDMSWVEEHLSEHNSYNWGMILRVLSLFDEMGYGGELRGLINLHPGVIFESSGDKTLTAIGFQLKFGATVNEVCSLFRHFPQIEIGKFVLNLRQCFHFLLEIQMKPTEIGKIVRSHSLLLGTCTLKKANSLLSNLNVGKKRLCKFIQENPEELKKWVLGSRVGPLPESGEDLKSKMMKTKFLLDLGYAENSNRMKKALQVFRGKGTELHERFDCLIKSGLDRKDVSEMVGVSPQILNQSKEVLEMKIDVLVNELGYPLSTLVTFPSYLSYTIQRVRLRLSMYNWLKDQGTVGPILAMSTIIACSDKVFWRQYVKRHPGGPQVWQDLKKEIYSE